MDQSGECAERTQSRDFALQSLDCQGLTPTIRSNASADGGSCTSTHRVLSDVPGAKRPMAQRADVLHIDGSSRGSSTQLPICQISAHRYGTNPIGPSPGPDTPGSSTQLMECQRAAKTHGTVSRCPSLLPMSVPWPPNSGCACSSWPPDVGRQVSTEPRFVCTGKRRTYETNPTAQSCVTIRFVPLRCVAYARQALSGDPLGRTSMWINFASLWPAIRAKCLKAQKWLRACKQADAIPIRRGAARRRTRGG
jgi:hypothetical protein